MTLLLCAAALSCLLQVGAFLPPSSIRTRPVGLQSSRTAVPRMALMEDTMDANLAICQEAAVTKTTDGEKVVDALLALEKSMRQASREDDGALAQSQLTALDGAWRLVFTTGTIDTQNKLGGRINYFPIKAVQCFNTSSMTLTNGIYLGDFAVLQFFGDFDWNLKSRKLEFDFDTIAVLGFKIGLGQGGAAQIGASTGLGSENNVERAKKQKKAFFNWISADEKIATARGGGGGLALWRRDTEMEALNEAQAAGA